MTVVPSDSVGNELDSDEQVRVERIVELHGVAEPTADEREELAHLEAEQVALEATRTGPP
jgi:hypothetical protein